MVAAEATRRILLTHRTIPIRLIHRIIRRTQTHLILLTPRITPTHQAVMIMAEAMVAPAWIKINKKDANLLARIFLFIFNP